MWNNMGHRATNWVFWVKGVSTFRLSVHFCPYPLIARQELNTFWSRNAGWSLQSNEAALLSVLPLLIFAVRKMAPFLWEMILYLAAVVLCVISLWTPLWSYGFAIRCFFVLKEDIWVNFLELTFCDLIRSWPNTPTRQKRFSKAPIISGAKVLGTFIPGLPWQLSW